MATVGTVSPDCVIVRLPLNAKFFLATRTFCIYFAFLIAVVKMLASRLVSFALPGEFYGTSVAAVESILTKG